MAGPRRSRLVVPWLAACGLLAAVTAAADVPLHSRAQGPAATIASAEEREAFLASARIIATRRVAKGTTSTQRVTLTDGTVTHDASVQVIDEARAVFESTQGTEINFKDSWRLNVAAYRLDRLLAIGMIPATVERRFEGRPGSFTWWVDEVLMDEQERYRGKKQVPDTDDWNEQMWTTRLFDQLIANVDRNLGNLLIDSSYRIWMIDHSRSFRLNKTIRSPRSLSKVDRQLLARLRSLDAASVTAAAGAHLNPGEVEALLARRDQIVAHFDRGGSSLLFDRRR